MMDSSAPNFSYDGEPLFKLMWLNDSGHIELVPDLFNEYHVDDRASWAKDHGYQVEETSAGVVIISSRRDTIWLYTRSSR
jgi:hypothetical protein